MHLTLTRKSSSKRTAKQETPKAKGQPTAPASEMASAQDYARPQAQAQLEPASDTAPPKARRDALHGIDLVKFLLSISIIVNHLGTMPDAETFLGAALMNGIPRLAIPFFMASSAFLLFRGMHGLDARERQQRIRAQLFRLTRLYLIWSAIYCIIVAPAWLRLGGLRLVASNLAGGLLLHGVVIPLWYFPAVLLAFCAYFTLRRFLSWKATLAISAALSLAGILLSSRLPFMLALLGDSSDALADALAYVPPRNGLMYGLIFISFGDALSRREPKGTFKLWISLCALAAAVSTIDILVIGKAFAFASFPEIWPFAFVGGSALFISAMKLKLPRHGAFVIMRQSSVLIYLTHMIVFVTVGKFIYLKPVAAIMDDRALRCIAVIALTVLGSAAAVALSRTKPFRWIKLFY